MFFGGEMNASYVGWTVSTSCLFFQSLSCQCVASPRTNILIDSWVGGHGPPYKIPKSKPYEGMRSPPSCLFILNQLANISYVPEHNANSMQGFGGHGPPYSEPMDSGICVPDPQSTLYNPSSTYLWNEDHFQSRALLT